MLPLLFEELKEVHIIFATFSLYYHGQLVKCQFWQKSRGGWGWEGGGGAAAHAALHPSPLGFYGTGLCFRTFF